MDECANQRKFKTVTIAIVSVAVTAVVAVLVFLLARYFIFTPVMSDDLFDFTFKLDGVVYQLPCDFKDFTENGWSISSRGTTENTMVYGEDQNCFSMSKGDNNIVVWAYNMSGNAKKIKDCKIGSIDISNDRKADFVIAKGINIKSSIEEIKNAYDIHGEHHRDTDNFTEIICYYTKDGKTNGNGVYFHFNSFDNKDCVLIQLKNYVKTDGDYTETKSEVPEYINAYEKPINMGIDFKSSVVKIEGDLYKLPAPVSEFINNGWKIIEKNDYVVAGDTDSIKIEKDSKVLEISIVNYATYQTTVESCAVLSFYITDENNIDIQAGSLLDGYLTIGSDKKDVLEFINEEFQHIENEFSDKYGYYEYLAVTKDREYTFLVEVDKETQKVCAISLKCDKAPY